eukprot:1235849-Pyramimonas_sp.AAC.1
MPRLPRLHGVQHLRPEDFLDLASCLSAPGGPCDRPRGLAGSGGRWSKLAVRARNCDDVGLNPTAPGP